MNVFSTVLTAGGAETVSAGGMWGTLINYILFFVFRQVKK